MTIALQQPDVAGLDAVMSAMCEWQVDGAAMQLHPGDLGWFWRFGAEATAAALRTWRRDGELVAVGLAWPDLLRLTTAPALRRDEALAEAVLRDVVDPGRGVLPAGAVSIEAPIDARLRDLLTGAGWVEDELWTPLRRDLAAPVEDPGVRVEVVGPEQAQVRAAVQRAAFDSSTFTPERWRVMSTGIAYSHARCLVALDEVGTAVAAVTVWSAGVGRPGLLEPMGVHRDHRGRGYGRAICVAAAGALRAMGSSSALVATPSSNVAAVVTYESAGFQRRQAVADLRRTA